MQPGPGTGIVIGRTPPILTYQRDVRLPGFLPSNDRYETNELLALEELRDDLALRQHWERSPRQVLGVGSRIDSEVSVDHGDHVFR